MYYVIFSVISFIGVLCDIVIFSVISFIGVLCDIVIFSVISFSREIFSASV